AVGRLESVSQAATTSDTQIAAVTNRIVLGHPRRGDSRPALAACKAIEPPIPPRRCRTPIPHGSVDVSRIRQLVPKVRHNRDEDHGSPQDSRCLRAAKNARFAPSRCLTPTDYGSSNPPGPQSGLHTCLESVYHSTVIEA